jgi:Xaa-Pro aminopeptidase
MINIKEKIQLLRAEMSLQKVSAYIVTGTDPHQSEYVADHWNIRKWLSGFTGSAGQLVVTLDFAGLWTDSRYFLQGEQELEGTGIHLMKQKIQYVPEYLQWVNKNLEEGSHIMFDGDTLSALQNEEYSSYFFKFNIFYSDTIINKIWEHRTSIPQSKAFTLKEQFVGDSATEKINRIKNWLKEESLDYLLLTALDDIAWVTNLRGTDVHFNPVNVSYLLVGETQSVLFMDEEKIDDSVSGYLDLHDIAIKSYSQTHVHLALFSDGKRIGIDPNQCNFNIAKILSINGIHISNPVINWKGCKNDIEIQNTRAAMVSDGVALSKALYWLESTLETRSVSEYELGTILTKYRAEDKHYLHDSFGSIVGYNGNGAIIHYSAKEHNCAFIKPKGILLIDSGGQYLTGTTDITRTISFGQIEEEVKVNFTLVLKGMIALSKVVFPQGISGVQLDTLARQYLWSQGLNYPHGTGHGVGYCLNVHEGPQGFGGLNNVKSKVPFEAGMITSNEPGFYVNDRYGIRIENLILTKKHDNFDKFLEFETLTLFPIDTNLIIKSLLSKDEITWMNEYHQLVYSKLSSNLDEKLSLWLRDKCKAI